MVKPQESSASTKDEEYGYTEVRGGSIVYDEPGYIMCEGAKAKTKNKQDQPAGDNIVQDQKERYEKLLHIDRRKDSCYSHLPCEFRGEGTRNIMQDTACKNHTSSNTTPCYNDINSGAEAIVSGTRIKDRSPIGVYRNQTSDNFDTASSNYLKPVSERKTQDSGVESEINGNDRIVQTNQDVTRRKLLVYVLIGVLYAAVLVLAVLVGVVIQKVQDSKNSDVKRTEVKCVQFE